ncbi:CPBP family intramembrane metalloprotease [Paucibacter sp. B2R-40]|uniref:CPBP family intramembrane glutamic endopeptidase n=1 Tax=Paucibacter sp. B2R-40 TaxID=2893554 RepID=UPI0021E4198B|nr:CPBP family intramembrane glutamic endopeptidase [Paucibacter sp. B2R-40]MCV2353471.1 CPBP family intramembrane metalloprotease [Paucibacter sp. B2R-40]
MMTTDDKPLLRRLLNLPISRMLAASLAMVLPLALSFALIEALLPKAMRVAWPNLVAALACALGYWAYMSRVERREVSELRAAGALRQWTRGAGLGVLLGLLTLAPLWGLGVYRIEGLGDGFVLIQQIPEMVLVSVLEELLIRGVVFRIAEQAWGSRRALGLSTLLFVAAHLPAEISVLGMLVTAAASLAFSAAYQLGRSLWAPIGMHFAWNYLFSAVFSVPVSGHAAKGWLHGAMSGPEWLSGGAYGVEASAMALLVWALAASFLLRSAIARGKFLPRLGRSI